jgi:hypothetical protein
MTSNYLSHDEFMPYAPDELGASVHVHHCRLGKGKNKMYVTRNQDGSVIAFCHHCTASGFHRSSTSLRPTNSHHVGASVQLSSVQSSARGAGTTQGQAFGIPQDCEGRAGHWPREALEWITKYLTEEQVNNSPLCFSPKESGIIFPTVNADYPHTIVGFQIRKFPASEPKYLTNKNKSLGLDIPIDPFYTSFSDTLVVTEDWISAYKAALAGYEGLPLLGSNMRESQFSHVVNRQYKRYVIALDNDNPMIRRQQRILETRFSGYGPTLLLKLTKDLKEFSLVDIKDLIE